MYGIDTNILVYAHNSVSPWHNKAKEFVEQIIDVFLAATLKDNDIEGLYTRWRHLWTSILEHTFFQGTSMKYVNIRQLVAYFYDKRLRRLLKYNNSGTTRGQPRSDLFQSLKKLFA